MSDCKPKWTPTPWKALHVDRFWRVDGDGYGWGSVATVWSHDDEGTAPANAHLIATASELYMALEAAREELRLIRAKDTGAVYNPILRVQMDIALAKALGEG